MPGVVASSLFPNLATRGDKQIKTRPQEESRDQSDELSTTRRTEAQKVTANLTPRIESSTRSVGLLEGSSTTLARRTRQSLKTPLPLPTARNTRSSRKRSHEDSDDAASPTTQSFRGEISSAVTSRAATPVLQPPLKKQKSGLKIKTS
jgi:hypothetical protein